MMYTRNKQAGFTIVELMIATLVFSVVLLLCAAGLVAIGRMYQKGNNSRAVQEVSRSIIDTIKNDFELSGGNYKALTDDGNTYGFCIGSILYIYRVNIPVAPDGSQPGLIRNDAVYGVLACAGASSTTGLSIDQASTDGGRELLGASMRIIQPPIVRAYPSDANAQSLKIRANVIYGADDLIFADRCRGGAGQEYCASSILETYATRRLQ